MSKQLTTIKVLEYNDNGTDKILHELDGVKKILKFDLNDVEFEYDEETGDIQPVGTYALSPNAAASGSGEPKVYAMGEPGSKQVIVLGDVPEPTGLLEIASFEVHETNFGNVAEDQLNWGFWAAKSWSAGDLIHLEAVVTKEGWGLFEWWIIEAGTASDPLNSAEWTNVGSYNPPYPDSDANAITGPAYSIDVVLVIKQNV